VNYTAPVQLISATITGTSTANALAFPICITPGPATPQEVASGYYKAWNIYTKDPGPTPGTCAATGQFLVPGPYALSLTAQDPKGNPTVPNSVDSKEFTIVGLAIKLVTPRFGYATTPVFDLYFTTADENNAPASAVCTYSKLSYTAGMAATQEGSTAGPNHNIRGLNYRGDIFIACAEPTGRQTLAKFTVGWITTKPTLSIKVVCPPTGLCPLVDPRQKYVAIDVTTNDLSACTLDGANFPAENPSDAATYNTTHEFVRFYDSTATIPSEVITDNKEHNFTYTIQCTNLAQLSNSSQANVSVNFGLFSDITVLAPPPLYNKNSFSLDVEPTYDADTCTVGTTNPSAMTKNAATGVFSLPYSGLEEKKYVFDIACSGAKTTSTEYNVTIDLTPPPAPTLNANDAVCNGKISAKFNSTDKNGILSYHYTISDGSGHIAEDDTALEELSLLPKRPITGTLHWDVSATDNANNTGAASSQDLPAIHVGEDEECGLPAFITLISPPLGFAIFPPYSVVIATSRASVCRYALQPNTQWSAMSPFGDSADKLTHTKTGFSYPDKLLYVVCNETDGTLHKKTIHIGADSTAPVLSVTGVPNPVVDPSSKIVQLTVMTNDLAYCSHNGTGFNEQQFTRLPDTDVSAYTSSHIALLDYSDITDTQRRLFSYAITCRNLAGLQNSTAYTVVVNLGAKLTVTMLSPAPYTADQDIILTIQPSKQAACTWMNATGTAGRDEQQFTTVEGMNFSVDLGHLADGSYEYLIACTAADGDGTGIAQFTVDTQKPVISNLQGPTILCLGSEGTYTYNITGLDPNPTIQYELDGPAGAEFQKNTTNAVIHVNPSGMPAGAYTLSLTPINHAGTQGDPVTTSVTVKDRTDDACLAPADHCTNLRLDPGEEKTDCGGTCPNACVDCVSTVDCPENYVCNSGVCVFGVACTTDIDCPAGKACDNGVCRSPQQCAANADCTSPKICFQGLCLQPAVCTSNANCARGYTCVSGVCVIPHCANRIQDSDETGLDCGDSCPACVACTGDGQCQSPPQSCSLNASVCVDPDYCSTNNDCSNEHICQSNKCVPVQPQGCSLSTDCTPPDICVDNHCAAPVPPNSICIPECNADETCVEGNCIGPPNTCDPACSDGENCVDGTCVPAGNTCTPPCADGETCIDGNCEPQSACNPPCQSGQQCIGGTCKSTTPSCTKDTDCAKDQLCQQNACVPKPKSRLLSILLIAFGIAIMGGAGYFLYQQDEEKRAAAARQRLSTSANALRPMNPQLAAKYEQERAERQKALQEAYAKHAAEKEAQRKSLFQGFGSETAKPESKPTATQDTKPTPSAGAPDVEYVDITKLKKSASQPEKEQKPKKTKKDSDEAFDELEKLGK